MSSKEGVSPLSRQCSGITREGRRCTVSVNGALAEEFCHLHDPSRSEARRRAASRAGRTRPYWEVRTLKGELKDAIADVKSGALERNDAAVMIQGYRALKDLIELERKIVEQEVVLRRIEALEERRQSERGGTRAWG